MDGGSPPFENPSLLKADARSVCFRVELFAQRADHRAGEFAKKAVSEKLILPIIFPNKSRLLEMDLARSSIWAARLLAFSDGNEMRR